MKTAEDAIAVIQELPPEEQQKVADYLTSGEEEYIEEENYSPEDIAKILKSGEEARQGINVETFSSMNEARKSLGLT